MDPHQYVSNRFHGYLVSWIFQGVPIVRDFYAGYGEARTRYNELKHLFGDVHVDRVFWDGKIGKYVIKKRVLPIPEEDRHGIPLEALNRGFNRR